MQLITLTLTFGNAVPDGGAERQWTHVGDAYAMNARLGIAGMGWPVGGEGAHRNNDAERARQPSHPKHESGPTNERRRHVRFDAMLPALILAPMARVVRRRSYHSRLERPPSAKMKGLLATFTYASLA